MNPVQILVPWTCDLRRIQGALSRSEVKWSEVVQLRYKVGRPPAAALAAGVRLRPLVATCSIEN